MDDANSSFGQLSLHASAWTPSAARSSSSTTTASVKEFVPGQGWTALPVATAATATTAADALQEDAYDINTAARNSDDDATTVPAGPHSLQSLGVSAQLWQHYRGLALESTRQLDPSDPLHKAIPFPYTNAYLLHTEQSRDAFGHPSRVFSVANRQDGLLYRLRRFDTVRSVSPKIAAQVLLKWHSIRHSNIASLVQCFCAHRAVFFAHTHIPGAMSLQEQYSTASRHNNNVMSEPLLWSLIVQLTTALQYVHAQQLALRTLDWAHISTTLIPATNNDWMIHIHDVGVVDALEFETRKPLVELQQQDLRKLGRLILSICTGTTVNATDADTLNQCLAHVSRQYSTSVVNLVLNLLAPSPPSIADVARSMNAQCWEQLEATTIALSHTQQALAAEYDSGRALRLLLKLAFINDRPEFGRDRQWSQSGDCYLLVLFRDYVFHQADGAGYPVMDLGHVVTALNKLDAASQEQVVLTSRDGTSLMVVTYADVAQCLENAFAELTSAAVPPAMVPC